MLVKLRWSARVSRHINHVHLAQVRATSSDTTLLAMPNDHRMQPLNIMDTTYREHLLAVLGPVLAYLFDVQVLPY